MDLLFEYENRPDMDTGDIVTRMSYGEPLPHEQAMKQLRRGMQMIRFGILTDSLEEWLEARSFEADMPVRLVWEPGLAWRPIVDALEAQPVAVWDPVKEAAHKQVQATWRRIMKEEGPAAAGEWLSRRGQEAQDVDSDHGGE